MPGPETFVVDTTNSGSVQLSAFADPAYDALDDRGRRRPAKRRTLSEDRHLNGRKRRAVMATGRDAVRNFAIFAWMVRRHLDFVTTFSFQAKTEDEGFNREFEGYIEEKGKRTEFDLARRHSRAKALRITEARAVVDGDCGWLKFASGRNRGRVQIVESDLINLPKQGVPREVDREEWVNGVRVDPMTGEARGYALCTRDRQGSGLTFRRSVPARSMIMRGYYDRPDQVRGVGPITASLNTLRDVYEGFDFALAKLKLEQLLGLKITRSATQRLDQEQTEYDAPDTDKGMLYLDLDPGDDAAFLEGKSPAGDQQNFFRLMIMVGLKAVDLPYSFFDEAHTNFYGSRGGLLQYLIACREKRLANSQHLDSHTRWSVGLDVAAGDFRLPSGKDFDFLRWQWVPMGIPWWDPSKEITGHLKAIKAGLTSPQRVCREIGTNFEDNLTEIAEALQLAQAKGIDLDYTGGGGVDLQLLADAAAREQQQQTEEDDAD